MSTSVTSSILFACILVAGILDRDFVTGAVVTNNGAGIVAGVEESPSISALNYSSRPRDPKVIFIRFNNDKCTVGKGDISGLCYTRQECSALGGTPIGYCAWNFGVCCHFEARCDAVITQNGTIFRNPNYPEKLKNPRFSTCTVDIRKPKNICQVRLNFNEFDIIGPAEVPGTITIPSFVPGTCKFDRLNIISSEADISPLCGNLKGQHIYLDFGASDTISLRLDFARNTRYSREWSIEIEMIPCNSESRAPEGCLQYFTGTSGEVESFNYVGGTHLIDQDYSICVRRESGMRSIQWTECSLGSVQIYGWPTLSECPEYEELPDYLTIMGGKVESHAVTPPPTPPKPVPEGDRFCDLNFMDATVSSSVHPFILHFTTDGAENGPDESSVGFCIQWQQNP